MKINDFLFVYGTLRYGSMQKHASNWGILKGRVTVVGQACLDGAVLYSLGRYPGLVLRKGHKVIGDLVQIMDNTLPQRLDNYEGFPILFSRTVVEVTAPPESGIVRPDAWVYTYNHDLPQDAVQIPGGDWMKFQEHEEYHRRAYG